MTTMTTTTMMMTMATTMTTMTMTTAVAATTTVTAADDDDDEDDNGDDDCDINGDGDMLDSVSVLAPSQTQTHRIGVIAGLRYEMDESNTLRLTYTFDRARHRQTGEVGGLAYTGEPLDVFPVNEGLKDVSGAILQKRDRLSYAVLHQVSGEYRGEFLDSRLTVTAGVRAPFFRRDLTQNCFTTSAIAARRSAM